jgi:NAD-dependent dihydropyrimidine dehydrogenase PreA subunit
MRAHYGYADGSGEYYIIIDTDRCDGCGACASACPKDIFEIITDDYDDLKASVRRDVAKTLGFACPGSSKCAALQTNCIQACIQNAIKLTW